MDDLLLLGIYLLVGAGAGVLAGLLGVGGGVVIVPVLVWVFRHNGFDDSLLMQIAVGTSLGTIVVTSLSSIRAHQRRGAIVWPIVLRLSPGIVAGAWLGAVIADALPSLWLQRVFACFIILVGIQMATGRQPLGGGTLPGTVGMLSAGGAIGTLSALVGIGGGSLTVPFLSWAGIRMRNAVATSAACGLPIALAGSFGFVVEGWDNPALPTGSSGYLYWPALLGIVCASFLTAPVGARLAHSLPVRSLKRVFALLLLVLGVRMLMG